MKKEYYLLSIFILFLAFGLKAQKKPINKAPGDTLYYQDFDSTGNSATNGLPTGWTVTNNTTTGPAWEWADSSGTTLTPPIVSPSDSNGFLRLVFPAPPAGPFTVDSYVSSGPISITPKSSVTISWYQSMNYCCSSFNNQMLLEVSTDSLNWTAFDASLGRLLNTPSQNGERVSLNVSNVLGNQSTFYVRFRWSGSSNYYWMIDDLLIEEGFFNSLTLDHFFIDFHLGVIGYSSPIYSKIPVDVFSDSIRLDLSVWNFSSITQTGIYVETELFHDLLCDSISSGSGLLVRSIDSLGYILPPIFNDSISRLYLNTVPVQNSAGGYYRLRFQVFSDSVSQPSSQTVKEYVFFYGDTVYAKGNDQINAFWSPMDYANGGNQGDFVGEIFEWDTSLSKTISSLSIYIPNDSNVIGLSISPRVYNYNSRSFNLNNAVGAIVASSPFNTTVNASMLNSWISLDFSPIVPLNGGSYLVGIEQTSLTNSSQFLVVGQDTSVKTNAFFSSGLTYINDSISPSWIRTQKHAAIRLNLASLNNSYCSTVNVEEATFDNGFNYYPNPTKGVLNLDLGGNQFQQLEIRNALGALVYGQQIVNPQMQLDLTGLEKGLYFISLIGDQSREVKKIILQ